MAWIRRHGPNAEHRTACGALGCHRQNAPPASCPTLRRRPSQRGKGSACSQGDQTPLRGNCRTSSMRFPTWESRHGIPQCSNAVCIIHVPTGKAIQGPFLIMQQTQIQGPVMTRTMTNWKQPATDTRTKKHTETITLHPGQLGRHMKKGASHRAYVKGAFRFIDFKGSLTTPPLLLRRFPVRANEGCCAGGWGTHDYLWRQTLNGQWSLHKMRAVRMRAVGRHAALHLIVQVRQAEGSHAFRDDVYITTRPSKHFMPCSGGDRMPPGPLQSSPRLATSPCLLRTSASCCSAGCVFRSQSRPAHVLAAATWIRSATTGLHVPRQGCLRHVGCCARVPGSRCPGCPQCPFG